MTKAMLTAMTADVTPAPKSARTPPPARAGTAAGPLYRFERGGLALLAATMLAFGGLVLLRSAFQESRKTDFGVYCRAAHAVRVGTDIYGPNTCDDNGWHYCYPPPFAVAMVPFADPFAFQDHAGYLPFWASVTAWYLLSVGLIAWSLHRFAAAVLPAEVPYSRRWWYARTVPFYVCIGGLTYTLARGQVNSVVVAMIAGAFTATCRRQPVGAGLWLAGAVAVKVIPVYLLLDSLVRKDWRSVGGLALGLALFLVAVPAAVWGWQGMIDNNVTFLDAVLAPGALGTGDQMRAKELTNTASTDSQSFQAALHNLRHPDPATRPVNADASTKLVHVAVSGFLTLTMLGVAVVRGVRPGPAERLIFLGCVTIAMLHVTPVSHMHYYALGLPLVAGLWLQGLRDRPGRVTCDPVTLALLIGWGGLVLVMLLPHDVPSRMRECGVGPLASVVLWACGLRRAAN